MADLDIGWLLGAPDEVSAQDRARAMANALRRQQEAAGRQQAMGVLGLLTGDKVLGGVGNALTQMGHQETERLEGQNKEIGRAQETRLAKALQARQMSEQARHNRENERNDRNDRNARNAKGGGYDLEKFVGEDGRVYLIDPRNPKAPAVPVTTADGTPVTAPSKDKPKPKVGSTDVRQIAEYDAAEKILEDLDKAFQAKTGAASGLMQYVPGTDAAQYGDQQRVAAQNIGTILEGGKLSDTDFPRYVEMLPGAGDSRGRAESKKQNLRDVIARKRAAAVQGFDRAGYDTGELTASPAASSGPPKIASDKEFDALPAGAEFIDPNGKRRRKPAGS